MLGGKKGVHFVLLASNMPNTYWSGGGQGRPYDWHQLFGGGGEAVEFEGIKPSLHAVYAKMSVLLMPDFLRNGMTLL